MLLIGSHALMAHGIDIGRQPADIDIVCSYDEAVEIRKRIGAKVFYPINDGRTIYMRTPNGTIIEAEIAWTNSRAAKLSNYVMEEQMPVPTQTYHAGLGDLYVPSLNVLYMLKMSHRYLKDSPHFLKTMKDIHLLRRHGCVIPESMEPFYKQRMADTYTYAHPKLNVTNGEFFDSGMTGVPQKYDHDSLHEAVKLYDHPAYTYFQSGEVFCSKELFFAQPEYLRLAAVVEESMVLALERSLVPFPGKKTAEEAFKMALMKVCTSITSGWFREYAWENYDRAVLMVQEYGGYDRLILDAFELGLDIGVVKLKE